MAFFMLILRILKHSMINKYTRPLWRYLSFRKSSIQRHSPLNYKSFMEVVGNLIDNVSWRGEKLYLLEDNGLTVGITWDTC